MIPFGTPAAIGVPSFNVAASSGVESIDNALELPQQTSRKRFGVNQEAIRTISSSNNDAWDFKSSCEYLPMNPKELNFHSFLKR
jgi:hypothetical protein